MYSLSVASWCSHLHFGLSHQKISPVPELEETDSLGVRSQRACALKVIYYDLLWLVYKGRAEINL